MVDERITELESTIKDLEMKISDMRREIRDIREKESSYWILKTTDGDLDYWDEYYTPVGFMTSDKAKEWYEKIYGERDTEIEFLSSFHETKYYMDDVFYAVSEEEYRMFFRWEKIDKAISSLETLCSEDTIGQLITDLENHKKAIIKGIGIDYDGFQHIKEKENAWTK